MDHFWTMWELQKGVSPYLLKFISGLELASIPYRIHGTGIVAFILVDFYRKCR